MVYSPRRVAWLFTAVLCLLVQGCDQADEIPVSFTASEEFKAAVDEADHMVTLGQIEDAIRTIDSAFAAIPRKSILDSYEYYRFQYELNLRNLKKNSIALMFADSVQALIERNGAVEKMASEYALAHYWRGDVYFRTNNFKEAYQEYYKGREIGKRILDDCGISDYNYRLGMVLFQQTRYREAKTHFLQCFENVRYCKNELGYKYRQQEVLSNIGLCYYNLKEFDSAAYYYQRAVEFIKTNIKPESSHQRSLYAAATAVIMGNMGSVYEARGDYRNAEKLYKESIRINLDNRLELRDAMVTNLKLAGLYHRMGNTEAMRKVLLEQEELLEHTSYRAVKKDWHFLMSKLHAASNPALAYTHLSEYDRLKDSLFIKNKELHESDIREQIKNIEKQHQISLLQKSFEKNTIYLIIAVAVACLSILGIVLIIYYVKKLREYVQRLADLNQKVMDQKKQIEDTMLKLETSNKDKDKILRVVAHDLRSPITAIFSLADLLSGDPGLGDEHREIVELIKTASNNSLTLSKEILDSATMQSQELKLEPTNMSDLVSSNIELLRFRAAEKGQFIDLEMQETPIHTELDKDKFSRVISNIVTNAIKFSREGSRILVRFHTEQNKVIFSVKDSGIGIPASIQQKVFEMFTEAKRAGTNGEKPYGLGLSIAKQIVEAHMGKIWFVSEEGIGTTFIISLPISNTQEKLIHNRPSMTASAN